jgi:CRP-like cAMP-binding protein
MDSGDLERLREAGTVTTVEAGHVLIERGQYGAGLYVILEGTVVVDAPEASRELGPGSVVGERALLSLDGRRTARVRAVTNVRFLAVDRIAFERLCADDPGLADRVAALAELEDA